MVLIEVARRRWQWAIALLIVVSLGLAYAGRVQASAPAAAPGYSAAELADAVLFADGPAAKHLASLERPKMEWTEEATRSREAIDKAIAGDEKWGASFAERIQSGDPNRITPALQDLTVFSRQALDELWGKETMDRAVDSALSGARSNIFVWQRYVILYRIIMIVRYVLVVWSLDLKDRFATGHLPDELTIKTIAENLTTRA